MNSVMVWRCNECGKEVIPEDHYTSFPRHSYTKIMRFSNVQTPPSGRGFVSNYDEIYTTMTEYKPIINLHRGPNLMPGSYRIDWSCEIYQSDAEDKTSVRLYDGDDVLMEADTAGISGTWVSVAGFKYVQLNNQNKNYQLQIKTSSDVATAGIRNSVIEFGRVNNG